MSYHDDTVPLRHMLDDARRALELSALDDARDQHPRDLALQRLVTAVGDMARRVSSEARARHPAIAWDTLVREADSVRAEYDRVNVDGLRATVRATYPSLAERLEDALEVEGRRYCPQPSTRANGVAIAVPRQRVAELCRRYHVRRLALFGSVLREDFAPSSDVDVLVEFEPGHTPGLRFFRLQEDLASVLGRPVDLLTRNSLSPYMRERVLAQAEDVFVAA